MIALIRDDIISLESFTAAEFKYKAYLNMIRKSGNYCYLDQFKKIIPSGERIVKGMLQLNLIGTENINKNYKYIYLTDTAMKYLYLRDSERDFSDIKKNRISVPKVNKNPSEKQLLSSAYKFHLIALGEKKIYKYDILVDVAKFISIKSIGQTAIENLDWAVGINQSITLKRERIEKLNKKIDDFKFNINQINCGLSLLDINSEIKELEELKLEYDEINKQIRLKEKSTFKAGLNNLKERSDNIIAIKDEVEKRFKIKQRIIKNYNQYVEGIEKNIGEIQEEIKKHQEMLLLNDQRNENIAAKIDKTLKMFENLYDISKIITRINDDCLEFIILDTGTVKTACTYIKKINEIDELNIGYNQRKIYIYSYSKIRAENLYNEFMAIKRNKDKALSTIKTFNSCNDSDFKPDFYRAAEKIYDETPEFKVEIKEDCFYFNSYKEISSASTKAIKRKDKKAIDDIIKRLNKKSEIIDKKLKAENLIV